MRRAFNRAAAGYDAAAVLQREVCTRMLERLEYIKLQPSRILDAGSGTGWGTRQLAQRYSAAQMIELDIASGMLQTARGSFGVRLVSDGGKTPYRLKLRSPTYSNMHLYDETCRGMLISDALAFMGSLDLVIPEIDR